MQMKLQGQQAEIERLRAEVRRLRIKCGPSEMIESDYVGRPGWCEDDDALIGRFVRKLRDMAINYGGKEYARQLLDEVISDQQVGENKNGS